MRLKEKIEIPKYSLGEELVNAISHGIGALLSVVGLVMCIVFSSKHNNVYAIVSSAIYGFTSIFLYTMSTVYHGLKVNRAKRVFRVIDHCSIFLLIAGTYTPYVLVVLPNTIGWTMFGVIWDCAIVGICLDAIDLNRFKKHSFVLYIIMGWMIMFSFKYLLAAISIRGVFLMISAGVLYTVGAVFYALGRNKKYMHSLFHLFVLAASILFFFSIFLYVI